MTSRKPKIVIGLIILAYVFAGCGNVEPGHNVKFAWRVVKCVYGGSMKPLSKHLTPDFENAMTTEAVREIGKQLKQRFGKPQRITMGQPVQEPTGGTTVTYLIETKASIFRMVMTIDESNRISSLDFPELYEKASPPEPVPQPSP